MLNEPENNMDKLLKAYAQKRREEAAGPFEMHGATRNLLQSEVARTIPQHAARPQGWRKLFSGFWSGLAWGGSMVAVLALVSLVWLEKGPPSTRELARNNESTRRDETRLGLAGASSPSKSESSASKPESPTLRSEGVSQRVEEAQVIEALAKAKSAAPSLALQLSDKKTRSETTDQLALKDDAQVMKREKEVAAVSAAAEAKQQSLSRSGLTLAPTADHDAADGVLKSTDSPRQALPQSPAGPRARAPEANLSTRGLILTDTRDSLAAPKGAVPVPGAPSELDAFGRSPAINIDTNNQPLPILAQAIPQDSPVLPEQNTRAWAFYKAQTAGTPDGDSNAVRLYFSQENSRVRYRQNFNSPPYPNILTAFQVQRNGNNLSIVDADGSVYEGTMETSNTETLEKSADNLGKQVALQRSRRVVVQKPAQVLSAPTNNIRGAERDQNLSFRATGTNRSLNQKVVFTGNFLPGSNTFLNVPVQAEGGYGPRATAGSTATRTDQTSQTGPALATGVVSFNSTSPTQQFRLSEPQILQWGRIEGKASVGGKSEYRIEAIRVSP